MSAGFATEASSRATVMTSFSDSSKDPSLCARKARFKLSVAQVDRSAALTDAAFLSKYPLGQMRGKRGNEGRRREERRRGK